MSTPPNRPLHRYVAAVSAIGLGLFIAHALHVSVLIRAGTLAWLLAILVIVGEFLVIRVPRHGEEDEITTATTFAFGLLLVAGPTAAIVAQGIASLVADLRMRKAPYKAAFNMAQYAVTLAGAGATLSALGFVDPRLGSSLTVRDLGAIAVAGLVYFLLNYGLTFVALALAQRIPVRAYLRRDLWFRFTSESVLIALAPLFIIASERGLLTLPLLALPMGAVYRSTRVSLESARSRERFRSLVQSASDVIAIVDATGRIGYCSPSATTILGMDPEQFVGRSIDSSVHGDDVQKVLYMLEEAVAAPGREIKNEYRVADAQGRWLHFEAIWTNLLDDPNVRGIVVNARDISRRKTLEEQLSHQAFHDRLTGLANRALFEDRVDHALQRAKRSGEPIAVLFVDVDDFKNINDSLGHVVGDELLVAVSERIRSCLRAGDTTARLGGDEFAILLEDHADVVAGATFARRILTAMQEPIWLHGREIFVGASIGIAASARGEERSVELLRNADVAMYSAKAEGKGRYEIFEPSMHEAVMGRLELGNDLQRAIERSEFIVHYQPTIDLATGRLSGVEALVRWEHPERGLLSPDEFIPAAEETGLIVPIGASILQQVCAQAAAWGTLPGNEDLTVGINISPRQLQDPDLIRCIRRALRDSGIDPRRLVLEITESGMIRDMEASIGRLHQLKALGIAIAMDDFGTGYSSFSYLRRLPIDLLKIDRSFVDGLGPDTQESALVGAIIGLAGVLGLSTVGEGVERPEQLAELRRLGCGRAQGFLISRPVEAARIEAMLRRGSHPVMAEVPVDTGAQVLLLSDHRPDSREGKEAI